MKPAPNTILKRQSRRPSVHRERLQLLCPHSLVHLRYPRSRSIRIHANDGFAHTQAICGAQSRLKACPHVCYGGQCEPFPGSYPLRQAPISQRHLARYRLASTPRARRAKTQMAPGPWCGCISSNFEPGAFYLLVHGIVSATVWPYTRGRTTAKDPR